MANGLGADLSNLDQLTFPSGDPNLTTDMGTGSDGSTSGFDLSSFGNLGLVSNAASIGQLVAGSGVSSGAGTMALVPSAGHSLVAMGAKFAARFPTLAGAIQIWRSKGINLTVEKLWGMARKFGPQFLVAAGILSLQALTELLLAHGTKKRRRMNPLNPRALSRSVRRLAGFERRAARVSAMLSHIKTRKRSSRARCFKCHHSPCTC
jgi:hypothetical protein